MIQASNLDGRLVRVVDVDDRRVARVQRKLHTDQRLEKVNLDEKKLSDFNLLQVLNLAIITCILYGLGVPVPSTV